MNIKLGETDQSRTIHSEIGVRKEQAEFEGTNYLIDVSFASLNMDRVKEVLSNPSERVISSIREAASNVKEAVSSVADMPRGLFEFMLHTSKAIDKTEERYQKGEEYEELNSDNNATPWVNPNPEGGNFDPDNNNSVNHKFSVVDLAILENFAKEVEEQHGSCSKEVKGQLVKAAYKLHKYYAANPDQVPPMREASLANVIIGGYSLYQAVAIAGSIMIYSNTIQPEIMKVLERRNAQDVMEPMPQGGGVNEGLQPGFKAAMEGVSQGLDGLKEGFDIDPNANKPSVIFTPVPELQKPEVQGFPGEERKSSIFITPDDVRKISDIIFTPILDLDDHDFSVLFEKVVDIGEFDPSVKGHYEKKVSCEGFGNIYKVPGKNEWYSKDTGHHGDLKWLKRANDLDAKVTWKKFEAKATEFKWIEDVDENGNAIKDKHKSVKGKNIPFKRCKGI